MPGMWQSVASFGAAFIAMQAYGKSLMGVSSVQLWNPDFPWPLGPLAPGPGRPVLDPWQPNQAESLA